MDHTFTFSQMLFEIPNTLLNLINNVLITLIMHFHTNQLLELCKESMRRMSLDGRTLVMKYDFIVTNFNWRFVTGWQKNKTKVFFSESA